jgi:hypothetical protein
MKSKLFIIALLALSVISCTREPIPQLEEQGGKIVTIRATIPPETRVAYDDANLSLSWQDNDQLLLAGYDGTTYKGSSTFTYVSGSGSKFLGTTVPGATTYKAYYPGNVITLDNNGNVQLPVYFWQQTQEGNNSTAHLRDKLFLSDTVAKATNNTFSLTLRSSMIKLNLSSIPQEVGKLDQLIYMVETASGVFKSVPLNVSGVTFSATVSSITAFLAFDPDVVTNIAANGKVRITLLGEQPYEWSATSTDGKNYIAGNRYTGTVTGGWTGKELINPLSFVAEYNVNPAGNGFVTDLTACDVSGYFTWDNTGTINISGYHLPSMEEWYGIVPEHGTYVTYVDFQNEGSHYGISENVMVQGETINMTSDYRNTGSNKNPAPSYALRYKGTDMVSAWKYELFHYNTNTCHMKITSRNVAPSETIGNIADETFWTTGNENDIVRCFPASGYYFHNISYRGARGYFRSTTTTEHSSNPSSSALYMYFDYYYSTPSHSSYKATRTSVRLFANPD